MSYRDDAMAAANAPKPDLASVPDPRAACGRRHPLVAILGLAAAAVLKAVSVRHFGFPHAAQVIQVTRKRRDLHTTKWQTVTVYAITSLPFELARPR